MATAVLAAADFGASSDGIAAAAAKLAEAIRRWLNAHDELYPDAAELGRRGWTIPVWLPTVAVRGIIQNTTPDTIDQWFLEHYRRRWRRVEKGVLKDLVSLPLLERWSPLIKECIKAYDDRLYLVVVPALLAIFEGALSDAAGQFTVNKDVKRHISQLRSSQDPGLIGMALVSVENLTAELFRNHSFASPPTSRSNRHLIMHGRALPASPQSDGLRLFQALHTMGVVSSSLSSGA
jgi:hypothetical protein